MMLGMDAVRRAVIVLRRLEDNVALGQFDGEVAEALEGLEAALLVAREQSRNVKTNVKTG